MDSDIRNIFITNSELSDDMTGRITVTSVLNTIPKQAVTNQIADWKQTMKTEWRWRFLQFDDAQSVEISYETSDGKRMYFNKFGEWVERDVPDDYDKYVIKTFYYYN
jgi:hypothetical protein